MLPYDYLHVIALFMGNEASDDQAILNDALRKQSTGVGIGR